MNDDRAFDVAMQRWLDAGSDRTPAPAIDAVLLAIRTTPQERDLRIPRRFAFMTTPMRLAAGVALVAIVGLGAFAYSNGTAGPGGPATQPPATVAPTLAPTAAATPSADPTLRPAHLGPISTDGWVTYDSTRYGFTISHPADWVATPADHAWALPADANWQSTGVEAFIGPPLRVSAWSVAVSPGTSAEEWIAAYCPLSTSSCGRSDSRDWPVTMDEHPGVLFVYHSDAQAFVLVDDRMYVVAAWRPESQRYVEAFLSTMKLHPGGPAPASN